MNNYHDSYNIIIALDDLIDENELDSYVEYLQAKAHYYYEIGCYEKALKLYKSLYYVRQDIDYKYSDKIFSILNNIALCYSELDKIDKSFEISKYVLSANDSIYQKNAINQSSYRIALHNISSFYLQENNIDSAMFYSKKIVDIRRENGDVSDYILSLSFLSYLYYLKGNVSYAIQLLNDVLSLNVKEDVLIHIKELLFEYFCECKNEEEVNILIKYLLDYNNTIVNDNVNF